MPQNVEITLPVVVRTPSDVTEVTRTVLVTTIMVRVAVPVHGDEDVQEQHAFTRGGPEVQYRLVDGNLWMPAGDRHGIAIGKFDDYLSRGDQKSLERQVSAFCSMGIAQHPDVREGLAIRTVHRMIDAREGRASATEEAARAAPELAERLCVMGNRIWQRSHGPMLAAQSHLTTSTPSFRLVLGRNVGGDFGATVMSLANSAETLALLRGRWPDIDERLPEGMPDWSWPDDDQVLFHQAEHYVWHHRALRRLELGSSDRRSIEAAVECRRVMARRWGHKRMESAWTATRDWHLLNRRLRPPDDLIPLIRMLVDHERRGRQEGRVHSVEGDFLLERIAAWERRRTISNEDVQSLASLDVPTV